MNCLELTMNLQSQLTKVLDDKHIGLTTVVYICEAIIADAKANIWFADVMKSRATEENVITFLDEIDSLYQKCAVVIDEFGKDHDLPRFEAAIQFLTGQLSALTKN